MLVKKTLIYLDLYSHINMCPSLSEKNFVEKTKEKYFNHIVLELLFAQVPSFCYPGASSLAHCSTRIYGNRLFKTNVALDSAMRSYVPCHSRNYVARSEYIGKFWLFWYNEFIHKLQQAENVVEKSYCRMFVVITEDHHGFPVATISRNTSYYIVGQGISDGNSAESISERSHFSRFRKLWCTK